MSWAEMKGAINSTIGTVDFKTIDAIIEGQKGLVASDVPIAVFESISVGASSTPKTVGTFTPKKSGTARIMAIGSHNTESNIDFGVKVLNASDVQIARAEGIGRDDIEIYTNFNITAGTTYTIQVYTDSQFAAFSLVQICASITDTSLYDYTITV